MRYSVFEGKFKGKGTFEGRRLRGSKKPREAARNERTRGVVEGRLVVKSFECRAGVGGKRQQ